MPVNNNETKTVPIHTNVGQWHSQYDNLLDWEPITTEQLNVLYVIVAKEAELDFTEGCGRHHVTHSHLQVPTECTGEMVRLQKQTKKKKNTLYN